jgi:methionine-R-sulfoxide reductase
MHYARPVDAVLRQILSQEQYQVTQQEATERPFANAYWNNKRPGIYVDVVSGEPLFSSLDKFDAGSGWPSFKQPLEPANITTKPDQFLSTERVEVKSVYGDSHLGYVYRDGPPPSGLRYSMNSAALRFIPKEELALRGYEHYLSLFKL